MGAAEDLPATLAAGRTAEVTRLLRLIGNRKRLMVLSVLLDAGAMAVGPLAEAVKLSQPALSQHLALLRDAGIVKSRRDGQSILYSLADPRIARLLGQLRVLYGGGTL